MARTRSAYARLIELLDTNDADFRTIRHKREGCTEAVSSLRGNELAAAAKCMVVMVKISKRDKAYVLAVVPGDRRVDLAAVKAMKHGIYAGVAHPDIAERLSGCTVANLVPFSWDADLEVVVDPAVYEHDEIYFNAGRLDRSIALAASDHRRIANAVEQTISLPPET